MYLIDFTVGHGGVLLCRFKHIIWISSSVSPAPSAGVLLHLLISLRATASSSPGSSVSCSTTFFTLAGF